jgi:hypothetical protein
VAWARAFLTAPGTYTAAAYIQNGNPAGAAKAVRYSFQLFDADNSLVVEREGTADIPPLGVVPIVEPNIAAGSRTVVRTLFSFSGLPIWQRVGATELPVLRAQRQLLAADGSRLTATIANESLLPAPRTTVAAVLFDAQGIARAASKSVISIDPKSSQDVTFTWPGGTPNIVRAEITILPPLP